MPANLKNRKILLYACCWAVSLSIGMYFRLYPLFLNVTGDHFDKAALLVVAKIRASVAGQIQKKFPRASEVEKNSLIQQGIDHILKTESGKFRESIDKVAKDLEKTGPALKRPPYLLEADPYNFYRLTRNIAQTGKISDAIQGSKYFNDLMLAPLGHWEPLTLHPYIGFTIYKFLQLFDASVPLMYAVSFTPLIVSALALAFFYLVCYLLGCSLPGSLVASLFFMLSPIFLRRSAFGWYDNDPYNVFFPLAIVSVLFLGILRRSRLKSSLFFSLLCAFLVSLYALFWQGWVYMFAILSASGAAVFLHSRFVLKNKNEAKNLSWLFAAVIAGCFAGVSAVFGINDFFVVFKEGWKALANFLTPQLVSWPDLYMSVGELRKASLAEAKEMIGSLFFLMTALAGFAVSVTRLLCRRDEANAPLHVVLTVFFPSCVFLAWGAQRFILLALVPMGIYCALGVSAALQWLSRPAARQPRILTAYILPATLACVVVLSFVSALRDAHNAMIVWRPIFNDTWEQTLSKIRTETPKNSIVNSWWPPGHFITSMAERRVTFDGATINKPQAYWMAGVFLSSDERYSAGILRMLNNSANRAAEYLQDCGIRLSVAVEKLKEICRLSPPLARVALKNMLNFTQTSTLLDLTHRDPPPSYVLVYNDFVEKSLELSFIGNWNFKAVEEIQGSKERLAKLPARNSGEYIRFLWDLAKGPYLSSEIFRQIGRQSNMLFFTGNVTVNLSDMSCRIASDKYGQGIPSHIMYLDDSGQVAEKTLPNASLPASLLLFKENNAYSAILADRRLAQSLLFRLYFFDGKGLKYFKPFVKNRDLTGRTTVLVFQVDWDRFIQDLNRE